ncbi:catenin beta-1 [Brachionus plicatilis]|uniref:Catenin beta-1 n=1 Tax=Brachionus plicatilis TaxID=10195 RepID=A0A3M7PPI0_BRAPC|nr:catenin beta-1 [Brachionus plicatilis]
MEYQPSYNYQFGSLPDATQSSEKALMWSHTQYMTESGYSTQAPSISSMDSYMNTDSQKTDATAPQPVQQQQVAAAESVQPPPEQEEDNAVANWINYQDNSEMALKAIPDLLKLLIDEDLVVVQQAAILLNQMARMEGPRQALIQTSNAVQCLVDCLNTTADLETARSLVGALYGISTQKQSGTQAIVNSKALQPLVKMLSAPMDTIVSYAITTLHNVLLDCGDKVKMLLRKMGMIHQMIPLLNHGQNVKFLSIVVDCLQLLAFGNSEAKQVILELGGTQLIVTLLMNQSNQYHKLLLNLTRLLKVLSVCANNKQALVNLNTMQTLSLMINSQKSADILQNCLIILRNLSDAATRVNGLEQLVQNLLNLLSQIASQNQENSVTLMTLTAGILSNLTCNNENNKKAALRANGVQVLFKIVQQNVAAGKSTLIEPCLCAIRHITNRYSDYLLAQEQVRSLQGIPLLTQLASIQPRAWGCVKALLGIVRNLCNNSLNSAQLKQNCVIEKLMQILYDAYTEINVKTNNGAQVVSVVKVDDVNLMDIVELSSTCLLMLAKEHTNQIIMKDLDCIGFFVQMFFSPLSQIQKSAASLLAELSANRECAVVIEAQSGLQQFVQANFCNQFGQLKSIAELGSAGNSAHASVILQHVTTLMQRLQEHKSVHRNASFSGNFAAPQAEQFGHPMYFNQQFPSDVTFNPSGFF